MPRILDMSFARLPGVPEFVIQYIRDQNLDDEDWVRGQTLVDLCLEEFCGDAELRDKQSRKSAKYDIIASIKRMVAEGVLLFLRREGMALFRLPVEQLAENSPSTITVEQRDKDAEEAETSLLEDDPIEDSEADRHAAGYAEMTRGARPLVEPPAEEDVSTPSRKRRRIEIAASESSSWNSLSPTRHTNSTPRRRPQRPPSPLSGSRRRSAPMQLVSPVKPRETRDYEREECLRQTLFKKEKKDTSPPWLFQGLNGLHSRYPDDTFQAVNGMINCLDCGREFKPANNGVANFETHLRSKSHRALVAKKIECGSAYQEVVPPKKFAMDYTEQQIPYTVFASKSEQSAIDIGRMFLTALGNETSKDSIRVSFLEKKVVDAQESILNQRQHFQKALEKSERGINEAKEMFNLLSEVLKSTANKWENQSREVVERLDLSESKNDELLKGMKRQIVDFEDTCEKKLDETNTRVAKNFQRTSDQYDIVKDHLTKSEFASKNKLDQLTTQISLLIEQNKSQDAEITVLRLEAEEQKNDVQNLQSQSQQLGIQVEELEQVNKMQDEQIQDLLSQSQLHTEELQRQRENNQSFQKTITDQMEAQFQQSERSIKKLNSESEDRTKALEQKMLDRIKAIEVESCKKIRSLEKKTAAQNTRFQEFEQVIPTIFEEAKEMCDSIDEMRGKINELGTNIAESKVVTPPESAPGRSRRTTMAL